MNSKAKEPQEPVSAPPAEQWFPLTLGSSFSDPASSSRFYSLRYEFKPASIDTTRPGTLFKSTDNKVTVDFCNNQPGKPKVSFQGNSEDCKELDGIIFFDGKSFRLERLHKAVKSLRHVRLPGESAGSVNINNNTGAVGGGGATAVESNTSPGHLNGASIPLNVNVERITTLHHVEETAVVQNEPTVEKKANNKRKADIFVKATPKGRISPPVESSPAEIKANEEVNVAIEDKDEEKGKLAKMEESFQAEVNIDDELSSDFEMIDGSEDDAGLNAAEVLRAQASIDQKQESSSSSSDSGSGSGSSGSESGSESGNSSSGSGTDDEDSSSSGEDI